jgi:hypothetical protein
MDVLLFHLRLTFFGGLGVKSAENRLTFLAPAFGALVLLFFPILYRKGKGILLAAILALELVVWHSRASFQIFVRWPPVSRRTPDPAIWFPWPENRFPIRISFYLPPRLLIVGAFSDFSPENSIRERLLT